MLFSENIYTQINTLFEEYPIKVNALLPILHLVQKERGYIDSESMKEVAGLCEIPVTHVEGVVTFYTMYAREKRGKCYLGVCTNISCFIRGGLQILEHIEKTLGIHAGQSTPDGKFYLEEVECLGACGYAPVMLIDEDYHEKLDVEKVTAVIRDKSKGK